MIADIFKWLTKTLESPVEHAQDIAPGVDTDLAQPSRGIYIGGTGSLKVTLLGGEVRTYDNIAGGITHAKRVTKVWGASTATGIKAEW